MAKGTYLNPADLNNVKETDKLLGGGDDEGINLPTIPKEEPKTKMVYMTMIRKVFLLLLKVEKKHLLT